MKSTSLVLLAILLLLTGCAPAVPPCGTGVMCYLCDGWGEGCVCISNPSVFVDALLNALSTVSYWVC